MPVVMPSQQGNWSQQAQSILGPVVGCREVVWKWEQLVSRPGSGGTLPASVPAAHPAEWERGMIQLQPLAVFWLHTDLAQTALLLGTVMSAVWFPAQVQSPELSMVKVFYLQP